MLILATLIAVLALIEGINTGAVFWIWAIVMIVALIRPPLVERIVVPSREEPQPIDPEVLLRMVFAGLAALDIPVLIIDREASVLVQNAAVEKAFGAFPAGAHISSKLRSPGLLDMVRETIATNTPNQIEHSERLPSERVYIVRIAPVELPEADVETGFFLLSFRDISELRHIDRMRSDFVANASHELRTPLASLRGFIETIQGPAKADPKAQQRFLGIMLDQTTRMSRLVDDLLSLSRLELKSHIAPDQKVDLVPLLGHVRDSLLPLAGDLDVTINLHMPAGKVEVLGDRDELVQVFENLMENACKYGQEGKAVEVTLLNEPGQAVEVVVSDSGPGIPAEHVPRLTERFYRVNVEDSRSKKGTGLGLAIVKHILTRHRARLIVKSEVGKGTDFTVRF
ncbi:MULTISPECIES: phosphate regulon sensor histidine kinase PhoR [Rhizobium]|jgi:two-component system phosphate regulon sensor histidine kinase PhoR|uniref:histidine kinase n=1 Tax=Rhizobium lusitanum TaxID=293958 RepID=A0A1C3W256_9HYPH|nr:MULTISPECIES: phosphate regulon sensor histidine kinase PhoR [Rhizobium]NKJ05151.1 two-component system phosphate regulon sensor histidine kinase PhoR [Rhizobium sp. SG741]NKJ38861.1 two-component system phosphate regulon sensor histidine kinase PhoR [Rhizobium sp. SG570]SCB34008.1 two-component system, OmpR family, phosphate regulon sensor histidine kinase PhoR [Rhizobium lusitanum]